MYNKIKDFLKSDVTIALLLGLVTSILLIKGYKKIFNDDGIMIIEPQFKTDTNEKANTPDTTDSNLFISAKDSVR